MAFVLKDLAVSVEPSLSQPSALLPALDPALAYVCPGLAEREDPPPHQPGIWNGPCHTELIPSTLRGPGLRHTAESPSWLHTTAPWGSAPLVGSATLPGDWL